MKEILLLAMMHCVRIPLELNVGIGTTLGSTAILELSSTTKAFVLPRMTKAQRNAISPAVEGMLIFQTDFLPGLRVRANGVWYRILDTVD